MKEGAKVKVKGTNHETTIKEVVGCWYVLETPHIKCCNYYSKDELELI